MTQKELLYLEDAIGHETNIIKIIEVSLENLEDNILIDFMQKEITIHKSMKEKLMNLLKEKSNE